MGCCGSVNQFAAIIGSFIHIEGTTATAAMMYNDDDDIARKERGDVDGRCFNEAHGLCA